MLSRAPMGAADQGDVVVVVVFVGHQDEVGNDARIVVADPQAIGVDRNIEVPVRLDRDQPLAPEADRDRLARVSFDGRRQQEYRKRGKTGMSHIDRLSTRHGGELLPGDIEQSLVGDPQFRDHRQREE